MTKTLHLSSAAIGFGAGVLVVLVAALLFVPAPAAFRGGGGRSRNRFLRRRLHPEGGSNTLTSHSSVGQRLWKCH
jgi:hypothetical protein